MDNSQIKIAFNKVKQDISFLENEIYKLKEDLNYIKILLESINNKLEIDTIIKQTDRQIIPTFNNYPTDKPTVPQEIKGLKSQNIVFSTGNRGVPTDRQTDQQTDQQTHFISNNKENNIIKASLLLDSLDSLKKDIRDKFRKLTNQEMIIFSTIYQLEEENPKLANYKEISKKLSLTESSIRDYTQKLIKKGIPIIKNKVDNKQILLSISKDLKKIASLSTILTLREL